MTLLLIVWRLFNTRPGAVSGHPELQTFMARVTHRLLYGLLIVMGVSGIGLIVLAGAAPILFLGAPGTPPRFSEIPPMAGHAVNAVAIVGLLGLLGLHVSASLYDQSYRSGRLLARMGIGSVRSVRDDAL